MRVMLYFGSFNPIHRGHMALAEYVLHHLSIDELWFVLSPQNPLKAASTLWRDSVRMERVASAIAHKPGMRLCDVELHLPRPNYTINTLNHLVSQYPDNSFSILIGADNAEIFGRWRAADEIAARFPIYVYPRTGSAVVRTPYPSMTILRDAPVIDISSTEIRNRMAQGLSVDDLIP